MSIFCGGCATFVNIDRFPSQVKKGYVEFQVFDKEQLNIGIYEFLPEEKYQWSSIYNFLPWIKIIRVATTPGVHHYFFSNTGNTSVLGTAANVKIDVAEGMVAYVAIHIKKLGMGQKSWAVYHGRGYEFQEVLYDISINNYETVSLEEANKRIERIKNKKEREDASE